MTEKSRREMKRYRRRRELAEKLSGVRWTWRALYARDGRCCWICGEPVEPFSPPQHPRHPSVDHVIPLAEARGDLRLLALYNDPDHVRLAHKGCNQGRRHGTPAA